jgi:hypothetical protein
VREADANPQAELTTTARAEAIYQFSATISPALSVSIAFIRERNVDATSSPAVTFAANAIEKFEPVVAAVTPWADVPIETLPSIWQDTPVTPPKDWSSAA